LRELTHAGVFWEVQLGASNNCLIKSRNQKRWKRGWDERY